MEVSPPRTTTLIWGACGLGAALLMGGVTLVTRSGDSSSGIELPLGLACVAVGLGALILAAFLARADLGGPPAARFGLRPRKKKLLLNLAATRETSRANFAGAKAVAKEASGSDSSGGNPAAPIPGPSTHYPGGSAPLPGDAPREVAPSAGRSARVSHPTVVNLQQRLVCLFAAHGYRAAGDSSVGGRPPNPRSVGSRPPNPRSVESRRPNPRSSADKTTAFFQKDQPSTLLRSTLAVNQIVSQEERERFFGHLRGWVSATDLRTPFVVEAGPLAGTVVELLLLDDGTGRQDPRPAAAIGSHSDRATGPLSLLLGELPGGNDDLGAELGRRAAFAFAGLGWHAEITPGSGEMLAHLEANEARAIARFPIPAGENLSPGELERLFLSVANELATPSGGERELLNSGPFAGASITFVTDNSPAGSSLDLRRGSIATASWGDSVRRLDGRAGSETPLQRDRRSSQILSLAGRVFPAQAGAGPVDDFFRRYGALCLLIQRDPYPVPLAEARAYLLERGLIDSGATNLLRFLAPRRFGPNPGAKVQVWLDSSPEAASARQLAHAAMQASGTLDEYIAKLRFLLDSSGAAPPE